MVKLLVVVSFLLLINGILPAQGGDIYNLLKKYEEVSDLSEKTKKESLGHVLVFTRKDLEIMQAYTLGDVLRLVPLYNFMPNQYGVETLMIPGRPILVPFIFKLYIDDHEVSSLHTFNPFLVYDRYPLDNIDHIEIYYTAGAISVSNEPSQVIIKLYTKVAGRENASKLRLTGSTDKSYTISFFQAKSLGKNMCYLISFSKSQLKFTEPVIHNETINRDQYRNNLFTKFRYFDTQIEFSVSQVSRNGFMGLALDRAPEMAKAKSIDSYLTVTQLLDETTKLIFAYDYQNRKYKEENRASDGGIRMPYYYTPGRPVIFYEEDIDFHKYSVSLNKDIETGRNDLLIGTFLRYYKQEPEKVNYADTVQKYDITNEQFRVENFYIASVYAEDSFLLNKHNRIIGGVKYDKYKYHGQKSQCKTNLRVGLISFLNDNVMFKGFASHSYILPSLMLVEASADRKLNPVKVTIFTGETRIKIGESKLSFTVKYYKVRNFMVISQTGIYNADRHKIFKGYSFSYSKPLNRFINVELNYWFVAVGDFEFSPYKGGYGRFSGEYKRVQFYADIVYKGSFKPFGEKIDEAYNLRAAFSYKLPQDWYIKVVGENLLNSSEKVSYINAFGETGYFSAYPRRILFTIEKVF